ncbi:hypothetical protein Syun_001641 [Stephania yunnanensis]|uniref:Uncharacterized protein n=1 Tax=Stephania yunnanensis TaxID=152371 RepID=A0AAP0LEJ0_9MAGN
MDEDDEDNNEFTSRDRHPSISKGKGKEDAFHWARHCIFWVIECKSFDEQGQGQGGIGQLPLR